MIVVRKINGSVEGARRKGNEDWEEKGVKGGKGIGHVYRTQIVEVCGGEA